MEKESDESFRLLLQDTVRADSITCDLHKGVVSRQLYG